MNDITKERILSEGTESATIFHKGMGKVTTLQIEETLYCTPSDGTGGIFTISLPQLTKHANQTAEATS